MRKIALTGALLSSFALAGCQTTGPDRVLGGAALGAGTGAVVGGVASRSVGGAVAGGLIGAAAGGIIGAATDPGPCYIRTSSGRLRRVAC